MIVDGDALGRIGASVANTMWRHMTTEQVLELTDFDPSEDDGTLWHALVSWVVTTVVGNVQLKHVAFIHDPPDDQSTTGAQD
jgi:hypothetical protein